MFKTIKIVAGITLLVSLSVPATGFARETPNCGDDKVKTWLISKATEGAKEGFHSSNVQLVLDKYMGLDAKTNYPQENRELDEFMKKLKSHQSGYEFAHLPILANVLFGKVDGSVGYDILSQYKNERIVAQMLQEIDTADANAKIDISLSAIRTQSKNDSIGKVSCVVNINRMINGDTDSIENLEYTAQTTEDGLLYME